MELMKRLVPGGVFAGAVMVLLALLSILPISTQAQNAGNKAVYNSNSTPTCCTYSSASIDASVFSGDICQQIYTAVHTLQAASAAGGVVDARGISSNMTCGSNETPWLKSGVYLNQPSTILLPAGTITISLTWILPYSTRLIGEQTATGELATTIVASGVSASPMIQFGDSHCPSPACTGISVESLTLNGSGNDVIGIQNQNSQFQSYVDHVLLYQILGTGLQVSGSASNSGPYSNITFDTGTAAGAGYTTCVQINGVSGTRGLHGITCKSEINNATNAILLDASSNSIGDVRILGFDNGIVVGSQATAKSNVLFNIYGDTTGEAGQVINVIKISTNATDLSIMGVANAGGVGTNTIADQLTSTTLADSRVAMYALGKPGLGGSGYFRFTTSPNATTWAVGSNGPSGGCTASNYGSLYSSAPNSGSGLLWVCENSSSGPTWAAVPLL